MEDYKWKLLKSEYSNYIRKAFDKQSNIDPFRVERRLEASLRWKVPHTLENLKKVKKLAKEIVEECIR